MAYYLVQATYTPEAWAALLRNPQPRASALQPVIQKLGGKIESLYLAFGDYDTVGIFNMPGNVDIAAFAMAAAAGGGVKAIKTTPLMTVDEGREAMTKAGKSGYVAPQAAAAV